MDTFALSGVLVALLFALAGLGWVASIVVRLILRHRPVPERAEPPSDLPPAVAGVVYAGTVRPEHLAATLSDLAGRGALRMEPEPGKRDWRLTQVGEHEMWPYEAELVRGIFRYDDEITVRALRTRKAFHRVARATMRGIWQHARDLGLVAKAPPSRRSPWFAAAGCLVVAGVLIGNPERGLGWYSAGLVVVAVALVATAPFRSPLTALGRRTHDHLRGYRARLAGLTPSEWTHEQAAYAIALGLHRELALGLEDPGGEEARPEPDYEHRYSPATLGAYLPATSFIAGSLAVIGLSQTDTGWADSTGGNLGDVGGDMGGADFGGGDFGGGFGGGFDGGGGFGGGGDDGGGGGGGW